MAGEQAEPGRDRGLEKERLRVLRLRETRLFVNDFLPALGKVYCRPMETGEDNPIDHDVQSALNLALVEACNALRQEFAIDSRRAAAANRRFTLSQEGK